MRDLARTFAVAIGSALLLGLLEAFQLFVRSGTVGQRLPWSEALVLTLPRWILLGLLAPGVGAMTSWFPLGRAAWQRAILAHVPAAVLFAVIHLAACVVVYGFLLEGMPNRFPFRLSYLLSVYFARDLFVYGALAWVFTAARLARESRDRAIAVSQLEARLTQAQLDALRSQLHPHFLFNALNATSVLARKGDSEGVVRMLGSLGDLLRASLDKDLAHEVPLARELALLDRYAEIQTVRFGDRLAFVRDIDTGALNALVPTMILQPIVENAVRHGIEARLDPGCVTIRAVRDGEHLRLEVRDTGPGFGGAGAGGGTGIGLSSTSARLQHLYGENHRVEIRDLEGGGAFVALTIPWRTVHQ